MKEDMKKKDLNSIIIRGRIIEKFEIYYEQGEITFYRTNLKCRKMQEGKEGFEIIPIVVREEILKEIGNYFNKNVEITGKVACNSYGQKDFTYVYIKTVKKLHNSYENMNYCEMSGVFKKIEYEYLEDGVLRRIQFYMQCNNMRYICTAWNGLGRYIKKCIESGDEIAIRAEIQSRIYIKNKKEKIKQQDITVYHIEKQ